VVGLPLTWPVELFSDTPGGSDPPTIEYVYGPCPPLTVILAEYWDPAADLVPAQGLESRLIGGGTTVMVQMSVSEAPVESVTWAVKV